MKELLDIFWTFCRIGGLTFGGGYAMLPMLQKEVVETKKWATEEEITDYYAVGQCTPGIIAVNTAIFIGYKQRGVAGAISAALGVAFPSYVIITIIAAALQNFADIPQVQQAFAGIRVCVVVLVLSAVLKLWKSSIKNKVGVFVFLATFGLMALPQLFIEGFKISPVYIVIVAAAFGVLLTKLQKNKKDGKTA